MEITRFADLKPRTVWEIADDAFDMYRERFLLLASVSAVALVPGLLLYNAVFIPHAGDFTRATDSPRTLSTLFQLMAWSVPLYWFAVFLQFGAIAFVVHDTLTGTPSSIGSVYKRTFQKFFPLLLSAIGIGFITLLSFCTLIGPLFVIPWFAFTPYGILLENRKFINAAKRSRDMGSTYLGKTLGMLLLMGSLSSLLTFGLQALIEIVYSVFPAVQGSATLYERETTEKILTTLGSSVVSLMITPLPAIAVTLLYYDLRVRREGLDIESEAASRDVPLAPDPFGGVLNPKVPRARRK